MKQSEFTDLYHQTIIAIERLIDVKGGEYAVDSDRLSNFKKGGERLNLLPEQIWSVYFHKHIDAIDNAINDLATGKKRPVSEPITGRVDDAIVYLILFKALVTERTTFNLPHNVQQRDSTMHIHGYQKDSDSGK